MNLNEVGESLDDVTLEYEQMGYDDPVSHAPSDYVEACRLARLERKRRDRNELQDLWREETRRRQREAAPLWRDRKARRK
jgi:hypothetical protein